MHDTTCRRGPGQCGPAPARDTCVFNVCTVTRQPEPEGRESRVSGELPAQTRRPARSEHTRRRALLPVAGCAPLRGSTVALYY
jgi:hypothetical protein